jgi:hypothetical protein
MQHRADFLVLDQPTVRHRLRVLFSPASCGNSIYYR